jgi:glycosyltransferase involved in cell wall biosynthesis
MINSIALNMVIYNEAHRIYDTLNKVAPYVDQMVIVNQQSTDDSLGEIWRFVEDGFPRVTVIEDHHWGYCEPSRKVAHAATSSDWILVLDADERISDEFASEMRHVDDLYNTRNVYLQRSFWLGGEHRFTGDYQHRFFHRNCVSFLDEIHTEPQPVAFYPCETYSSTYIGIWHEKTWEEQIRDEEAYAELIPKLASNQEELSRKLSLNVHTPLVNATGLTPQEIDALTLEERKALGL